uniref:Protein msta-like n=2 Tax=Hirondellea gigas TaxID=1518452 RepID=A0A6A7G7A2_9CRUS
MNFAEESPMDVENDLVSIDREEYIENNPVSDGELPYKVVRSDYSGRSLVATKGLLAGYQVIQELPLLIGPTALSVPICLSCHAPVSTLYRCPVCQWPMCSETCSDDPLHISECQILSHDKKMIGVPTNEDPTPRYDLILILRCLLLKHSDPKQWKKLLSLNSHWKQRKKDAEPHHMAAVQYFSKVCPTGHDEDTLHKIRGIVITNCINSRTSSGVSLRGIYPTISLLNHSCRPSVALRSDEHGQLFVHTTVEVEEDDQLVFSYVPPGEPYWKRQRDLHDVYYFKCSCERCADRTEINTHFSSLKCPKCKKGFMDPMLNKKKTYRCSSCNYSIHQVKLMHLSIALQALYNNEDKIVDVASAINLLKEIHVRGHGKHYTWLACAAIILKALGKTITMDAHRLRKQLWMRVIDMHSILEPGMTRRRGVSLLQLSSVSAVLAIQDYNIGRTSKVRLLEEVQQCQQQLIEARQILMLEPPASTEQRWLRMEEKERRRLEEIMEQVEDLQATRLIVEQDEKQKQEDRVKELEDVTKQESDSESESESEEERGKDD